METNETPLDPPLCTDVLINMYNVWLFEPFLPNSVVQIDTPHYYVGCHFCHRKIIFIKKHFLNLSLQYCIAASKCTCYYQEYSPLLLTLAIMKHRL